MIVLGIDTSDYANALGVVDGGRVLAEVNYPAATSSIEKITLNIDDVLRRADLALADIRG